MLRAGVGFLDLDDRMSMHFVLETFNLRLLLDIHVFSRSRQDWRESFRSLGSLPTMKMVVSLAKSTVE